MSRIGIFIIFQAFFLFFHGLSLAQDCYCIDCAECEAKIADPSCSTIYLLGDMRTDTYCIKFDADNKTLDCQGFHIMNNYPQFHIGIDIVERSGNVIKNCVIHSFCYAFRFEGSSENTIISNELYENYHTVQLNGASNNIIQNNHIHSNRCGVILNSGSEFNKIINNVIDSNSEAGLELLNSVNNQFLSNRICNNQYDFFMSAYGSENNAGHNNWCNNPGNWNDNWTTGCTNTCDENVPTVSEWAMIFMLLIVSFTLRKII